MPKKKTTSKPKAQSKPEDKQKKKQAKKTRVRKLTVENVAKAIKGSGGIMATVARRCKVDRAAVYRFLQKHPDLKQALNDEREIIVDTAEERLYSSVKKGEPWAIKLVLHSLGKNRGYSERHEITGAEGRPIEIEQIIGSVIHEHDRVSRKAKK